MASSTVMSFSSSFAPLPVAVPILHWNNIPTAHLPFQTIVPRSVTFPVSYSPLASFAVLETIADNSPAFFVPSSCALTCRGRRIGGFARSILGVTPRAILVDFYASEFQKSVIVWVPQCRVMASLGEWERARELGQTPVSSSLCRLEVSLPGKFQYLIFSCLIF